MLGTQLTTDIAYKLFHLRVVVDLHQKNATIYDAKPKGTSNSNGEEKQISSTQSGSTYGMTGGFTLPHQIGLTGTAMKANNEIAGSEMM